VEKPHLALHYLWINKVHRTLPESRGLQELLIGARVPGRGRQLHVPRYLLGIHDANELCCGKRKTQTQIETETQTQTNNTCASRTNARCRHCVCTTIILCGIPSCSQQGWRLWGQWKCGGNQWLPPQIAADGRGRLRPPASACACSQTLVAPLRIKWRGVRRGVQATALRQTRPSTSTAPADATPYTQPGASCSRSRWKCGLSIYESSNTFIRRKFDEQKKGGEVALPARISTTTLIWNCLALQQRHDVLRQRVGLRQHRSAGLLQDLGLGQVGGFCREVGVLDA
jgi:hypothetical protein